MLASPFFSAVKNTKWSRIIATHFLTGSSFQLETASQKPLVQASFLALCLIVLKWDVLIKKQMVSMWQLVSVRGQQREAFDLAMSLVIQIWEHTLYLSNNSNKMKVIICNLMFSYIWVMSNFFLSDSGGFNWRAACTVVMMWRTLV